MLRGLWFDDTFFEMKLDPGMKYTTKRGAFEYKPFLRLFAFIFIHPIELDTMLEFRS